jgi:hypothetical protein
MLERLGKVCGWTGTGLALLIVVWGFLTWHPGNGGPLYFGVLAAVVVSSGRRFATSLLASHLTDNFRHPVGFVQRSFAAKPDITDRLGLPLRTRTKIYGSTDPLSKRVCFCRFCAPRDLQHLIRNFEGEKFFLILVEGHFIHGICPSVYGQSDPQLQFRAVLGWRL